MTNFIQGTNGNDSIVGTSGDDSIFVQGGDDTVDAGAGDDVIGGASGGDVLNGEAGNDTIFGAAGDDIISGGAGSDEIFGGAGDDQIISSNDIVFGGAGADSFTPLGKSVFVFGNDHGFGDRFTRTLDNSNTILFTDDIQPDDLFVVGNGGRNVGFDGIPFTNDDFFLGFTVFTGQGGISFTGVTDAILIESGAILNILPISFDDSII